MGGKSTKTVFGYNKITLFNSLLQIGTKKERKEEENPLNWEMLRWQSILSLLRWGDAGKWEDWLPSGRESLTPRVADVQSCP